MSRMVFIAWKDILHPAAGGAERFHHELSLRFVRQGHEVVHLVPGFPGAPEEETVDGVRVVRAGSGVLAFPRLRGLFRRRFLGRTDWLVDVFNCVGSGACLDLPPDRAFLLVHHVQGRLWRFQTSFFGVSPWVMPALTASGWFIERAGLLGLARRFGGRVLTVSDSTASELRRFGFRPDRIRILSEGIRGEPLASLDRSLPKEDRFTVLMIGPRKSKRPAHGLKAFARFHGRHPDARLQIAGWGTETDSLRRMARRRGLDSAVEFMGRVSERRKGELLQRAHVLITTPVKEGWGLVVVEANAMGTPVIGYRVPGLRDALAFDNGVLCEEHPGAMARALAGLYDAWRNRPEEYRALRRRCLDAARPIRFDRTHRQMMEEIRSPFGPG